MIQVACVRTGSKYGIEYVTRLRDMVRKHLPLPHTFVCITDDWTPIQDVELVRALHPTWWAKMRLFEQSWRSNGRLLYFDLDTVITGDLTPLAELKCEFGICQNFTKLSGHATWPCNYGSCVMSIAPGYGDHIWQEFNSNAEHYIAVCQRGDQQAIEQIEPNATYLQDVLPSGYFVGRRDFCDAPTDGGVVYVFAGRHKPHNTPHAWLHNAWKMAG